MIQFKRLAKTVVLDAFSKLLAGLTTIILIRSLPSDQLAYYGLALATALIVYQVIIYTLNQYELVTKLQRNNLTYLIQIGLSISLIYLLNTQSTGLLALFIYFIGLVISDSARLFRHQRNEYVVFSVIDLLKNLLVFISILFLFKSNTLTVEYVFYIQGLACLVFFGKSFFKFISTEKISTYTWKTTKPSFPLFVYFFMIGFIGQIEPFVLNNFSNSTELSKYTVSQRLFVILATVLASINSVYLAESTFQNSISKLKDQLHKHLKFIIKFIFPVVFLALLFGKPVYALIVSAKYQDSYLTFCIMITIALIGLMFSPFVNLCILRKQYSFLFKLTLSSLIINIISNLILTDKYGANGAAISLLVATGIINIGIITKHLTTKDSIIDKGA